MSRFLLHALFVMVGGLAFAGCSDDGQSAGDTYDRKAMLTDVADGLILPGYARLELQCAVLTEQVHLLTMSPTAEAVEQCRSAWIATAEAWQDARAFDFGPAEGLFGTLAENIGTYPASEEKIEQFIAVGDTSLSTFDRDSRGVYGTEYLLFAGSANNIADALAANEDRRAYLRSVVRNVHQQVAAVHQEWTAGYRATFIASNGTESFGSTSLLFNNMVRSYEQLKNYALGLPLGKIAGQAGPEPTKVEGFYSGRSIALARRHYASVMRIWEGVSLEGNPIQGFRSYLETVPGGTSLIEQTVLQDALILEAFGELQDSEVMSDLIVTDPSRLEALHVECQKMTRFLKSDLSSLIGIAITYASGDGD